MIGNKQSQNSVKDINKSFDDTIDFNSVPKKLVDFYSIPVFKTEKERNEYIMGQTNKQKCGELKRKFKRSVSEADDFNAKRIEWIENEVKNMNFTDKQKELRKNLKILIIFGSKLKYMTNLPKKQPDQYISGFDEVNTALLIQHLFHYACKIDYDNILITSSNSQNFYDSDIPEANISPTNSPTNSPSKISTSESSNPKEQEQEIPEYLYQSSISTIYNDFAYAQIGEKQYQFIPDVDVYDTIKPFNRYFLQTLKTDKNTELLVFFIDHGDRGFFHDKDYQYFVERMMEIPTNHITVFNDCCHSGSLIELIEISELIIDIFGTSQTSDIFKKLYSIARDESKKIDEKIQDIFNEYQINKSQTAEEKLAHIINLLKEYYDPIHISPKLFIDFKNKSTIICSCSSTKECSTLPIREIIGPDQYGKQFKFACAQGGVFSSIILNSLFYPESYNDFSLDKFTDNLMSELKNIEREFKHILIKQNTFEEPLDGGLYSEEEWKSLKDMYENEPQSMEDYFHNNFKKSTLSISSRDSIPNIRSITIAQKYWHVDITYVDPLEYNTKVYYYIGNQHQLNKKSSNEEEAKDEETKQDPNQYVFGPVKGIYSVFKFILDFSKTFEKNRKEKKIDQKFDLTLSIRDITEETEKNFHGFYSHICGILDHNMMTAFNRLLPIIQINYQNGFNKVDNYFQICYDSLKEIACILY